MSKETKEQTAEQDDVRMLLACRSHLGSKTCTTRMTPYVYGRNEEGVYVFNPKMTLEKIRLAARIIAGVENPADVCVVSSRLWGQRAVLKFAKYVHCTALPNKFTPGTFTNQIQKKFLEPRLLIVTDPVIDHQPITESSYVNIPVIAICDSDAPLRYVDVAIPANNKGKQQIGIIYWMLAREVLRIRGELPYKKKWDVMPDLFFYRDPNDRKKSEEEDDELEDEPQVIEGGHENRQTSAPEELAAASSTANTYPTSAAQADWSQTTAPAAEAAPGGWGVPTFAAHD